MDLAASIQAVLEEVILRMTRSLQSETGATNLCLAGGVALNCVANGKILRDGRFNKIWIQPAAGDAGGALGAALAAWYGRNGSTRRADGLHDTMHGAYLGPEFSQDEIERRLTAAGAQYHVLEERALRQSARMRSRRAKLLAGFRGAWSSVHGRWARAPF